MSPSDYLESRAQAPQWFRAPSNMDEAESTCAVCGELFLAGELVGEVDDMQLVHEACIGDDDGHYANPYDYEPEDGEPLEGE